MRPAEEVGCCTSTTETVKEMPKNLILRGIGVSVRLSSAEHDYLLKRQQALGLESLSAALRSLIPSVTPEHVEAFEARVAALEKDVAELKLKNNE